MTSERADKKGKKVIIFASIWSKVGGQKYTLYSFVEANFVQIC